MAGDEEDDYLSMSFGETPTPAKETSLQRTTRLKKEAAERGRPLSKAERTEQDKAARDLALATQIDSSNKGARMMAKMGFKGGALGQMENARTTPIELLMKTDRGGIGMESDKKRKIREAAEATDVDEKRQKVGLDEYRERNRAETEDKRAEGLMWGAMMVLEGFETEKKPVDEVNGGDISANEDESPVKTQKKVEHTRLSEANVLYRPLLRQRLEKERDRKMQYDLNNSLSTRNHDEDDEDEDAVFDKRAYELDDDDPELRAFEELTFAEKLEKIVEELREKFRYCFWCKYQYPDQEMDGCPGATEDEHG